MADTRKSRTQAKGSSDTEKSVLPPSSRPRPSNAMVASAARIKLSDRRNKPPRTSDWQNEAWVAFDAIGEVKHAMYYVANHLAKMRLFPAMVPDDPTAPPVPDRSDYAEVGAAALAALRGRSGGYGEILKEAAVNLFVPGECWLIGLGSGSIDDEMESWEIKSTDEFEVKEDAYYLREVPNGAKQELHDGDGVFIRIWLKHPRFSLLPDSPLRGVLASCEEVMRIERVIRGAAKSRSAGAGLLLVPEEASFGSIDPTIAEGEDPEMDPFTKELIESMTTAIKDEGSASSVVPLIVRAPADVLKEIRRVDLSVDVETELVKLDRALTRLAQGLPLPPEIVTGKADLNHWTAWSVDENTISAYVEPLAVPIVDSITTEYYRAYLIEAGVPEEEAERRMVWYDPTPLVTRPNRSADADFGLEHNAISEKTWRRIKGLTEEDAPTDLERLTRLLMQRGSFDPVFTRVILAAMGMMDDVQNQEIVDGIIDEVTQQPPAPGPSRAPSAPRTGPPEDTGPSSPTPPRQAASIRPGLVVVASAGSDGIEPGTRLADIDREVLTRLHTTADHALTRALERSCSIVRSKMRNTPRFAEKMTGVPKLETAARIGRLTLASEGIRPEKLLEGSFDVVAQKFEEWVIRAYSRAARVLSVAIPAAHLEYIDQAKSALVLSLTELAIERLFDPNPVISDDVYGELDDTNLVPFQLVRRAVAMAGGCDLTTALPSDHPLGGVATGDLMLAAFCESGGIVEGWEWCYGVAARTRDFEQHADLDGLRFSRWNEAVLSNRTVWPATPYYFPGDHPSCLCVWAPVITSIDKTVAMEQESVESGEGEGGNVVEMQGEPEVSDEVTEPVA